MKPFVKAAQMVRKLLFGCALLFAQQSQGQSAPQVPVGQSGPSEASNLQSPNAAAAESYGNVPVSPYVGAASVNIPLYTLDNKKGSVPVSLSYRTSGFRPDDHPGWVGMGWNLNCGGLITRSVKDMPDEFTMPIRSHLNLNIYPYYSSGIFFHRLWRYRGNNPSYMSNLGSYPFNAGTYPFTSPTWFSADNAEKLAFANWVVSPWMLSNNVIDTEPDEFSFNVNGLSGKFYVDVDADGAEFYPSNFVPSGFQNYHTPAWRVQCSRPVKVELINSTSILMDVPFTPPTPTGGASVQTYHNSPKFNVSGSGPDGVGYPPSFRGFILTTEDGTKYVFGGAQSAVEYSIDFFRQNTDYWTANAWHLVKIIPGGGQGRPVEFTYETSFNISGISGEKYVCKFTSNVRAEYVSSTSTSPTSLSVWNLNLSFPGVLTTVSTYYGSVNGNSNFQNWISRAPSTGGAAPTYSGKLIRPVYLSRIQLQEGETNSPTQEKPIIIEFQRLPTSLNNVNDEMPYDYDAVRWYYNNRFFPNDAAKFNDIMLPFLHTGFPSFLTGIAAVNWALNNLMWAKLDIIRVKYGQNIIKNFQFQYTTAADQRLQLLELKECESFNNNCKPSYFFDYYSNPGSTSVPYLSGNTDHWGFFNGQALFPDNYGVLLPNLPYTPSSTTIEGVREPFQPTNPNYLEACQWQSLRSVTYPTGGHSEFEYEPHDYSQSVSLDRQTLNQTGYKFAGGIRIKRISHYAYDGDPVPRRVSYVYKNNYVPVPAGGPSSLQSSGILEGEPKYSFRYTQLAWGANQQQYLVERTIASTNSIFSLPGNSQGAHVGYSEVAEVYGDGGFKVYKYTNYDTGPLYMDEPALQVVHSPSGAEGFSSNESMRGNILSEEWCKQNPNGTVTGSASKVKLMSKEYNYYAPSEPTNLKSNRFVKAIHTVTDFELPQSLYNTVEVECYKMYTYIPFIETTVERSFDENGTANISKTTRYHYNSNRTVQIMQENDGQGRLLSRSYRYPSDLNPRATYSQPEPLGLSLMSDRGMIGIPLEVKTSINGNVVDARLTTYQRVPAVDGGNSIVPAKAYRMKPVLPVANQNWVQVELPAGPSDPLIYSSQHYDVESEASKYDQLGNIEETKESPDGYVSNSTIWGYKQTLPIAEAKNARADQIAFTGFEEYSPGGWAFYFNTGANRIDFANGNQPSQWKNWVYDPRPVNDPSGQYHLQYEGRTGELAYVLDGLPFSSVSRNAIPEGEYVLRLWAKAEDPVSSVSDLRLTGGGAFQLVKTSILPDESGWMLCSYQFKVAAGGTASLSLDCLVNKAVRIDDLRLQPLDAQMVTRTYKPLMGVSSSTDENFRITTYEYDGLGRISASRDGHGNLLKVYEYNFK